MSQLPHPIETDPQQAMTVCQLTHGDDWRFAMALPPEVRILKPSDQAPDSAANDPNGPQVLERLWYGRDEAIAEVFGVPLEWEIDPADWLTDFARANGRQLVSQRAQPTPSGIAGDLVVQWEHQGRPYAARMFAAKWGNRLYALSLSAPRSTYASVARCFFETISTFVGTPAPGHDQRFAEPMIIANRPPCRMMFPGSWQVLQEPTSDRVLSSYQAVQTEAGGRHTLGRLSAAALPIEVAQTPREAAARYFEMLAQAGAQVQEPSFEEHTVIPLDERAERYEQAYATATRGKLGSLPIEARCIVAHTANAWVIAGSVGPAREVHPVAWMRCKRALEVVVGSAALSA